MWSGGHHKILSPEIQKILMVSNFGDIFGSHISGPGSQKKFSLENGFSPTKATLYLKMKLWVRQYTKVPILPDFMDSGS